MDSDGGDEEKDVVHAGNVVQLEKYLKKVKVKISNERAKKIEYMQKY